MLIFLALMIIAGNCLGSDTGTIGTPKVPRLQLPRIPEMQPLTLPEDLQEQEKSLEDIYQKNENQLAHFKDIREKIKEINEKREKQNAFFNDPNNITWKRWWKKPKYVLASGLTCVAIGLTPFLLGPSSKMPVRFAPLTDIPWISRPIIKYTFLAIGWVGTVLLSRFFFPDPTKKILDRCTKRYTQEVEPLVAQVAELEVQLNQHEEILKAQQDSIGSTKSKLRTIMNSFERLQRDEMSTKQKVRNLGLVTQQTESILAEHSYDINKTRSQVAELSYSSDLLPSKKHAKSKHVELDVLRSQCVFNQTKDQSKLDATQCGKPKQEQEDKDESNRISLSRTTLKEWNTYMVTVQKEREELQKKLKDLIVYENDQFAGMTSDRHPDSPKTAVYKMISNALQESTGNIEKMQKQIEEFSKEK